jgi:ribonucleoside-diphosphate reductase alpha chain
MKKYDLQQLAAALRPERDEQFDYLGIATLNDRYFLNVSKRRIEVPQGFFMRVAMGLALNETDYNGKAIEFYDVLSKFDFMSSTPTLFNSGSTRSQLASCYLTTVPDDLFSIFESIKENALLQKHAGGLGNDWTPVRSLGAHIKGTNGESQGVVPFLKIVNDTAIAVNQGGKRKGAVCAYLETWHMDIVEFLELRKNTGDDRRRTHDMNTANWIPDLFMKRVFEKGNWTLFSPNDCPDLHEKYGRAFEAAYTRYEALAQSGVIKVYKTMPANDLWRKMLTMLFETGHPWITFKDPCNIRSPQQHVGVVHSSNLCTEITLNTSDTETAVCNLGSVNLVNHMKDGGLDMEKLKKTIQTAVRMLDNVIDLNYYGVEKARASNMRHRPIGLGMMGFQDALFMQKIPYASAEAVIFADTSTEAITYFAFEASADLARERGAYGSFNSSLWSKGILPIDSLELLEQERGWDIEVDRCSTLDWAALREKAKGGMRNSNCVAIAPTATIGNIVGVEASIEPLFTNLAVKSNLAGEFTVLNSYLVQDLKAIGLWDVAMVMELKRDDGSIQGIGRIPQELRDLYKTAFEVGPMALIDTAARRQKWIDQAQSLNIYIAGASGKVLDETYKAAWKKGLKTTYYLRTSSATSAEKSTIAAGSLNAVAIGNTEPQPKFCSLDDPGCESCQ